ncbi:MAG: hydrolase [Candidatus Saccharibacteria bacterium]|nr:hydrolase [Candidatus Saccharibacteria bacterium]
MTDRLKAWGDKKIIRIACCFIFNETGEVLLLQRHSDDLGGGKWGTAGGRIEHGEEPKAAVIREVREETGLQLDEIEELGTHEIRMPHGAVHMTSFRSIIQGSVTIVIDPEEHHEYKWFDISTIKTGDYILWGIPTILHDFGLLDDFDTDPTLADGSQAVLLGLL